MILVKLKDHLTEGFTIAGDTQEYLWVLDISVVILSREPTAGIAEQPEGVVHISY
jgi:hypothetical protein